MMHGSSFTGKRKAWVLLTPIVCLTAFAMVGCSDGAQDVVTAPVSDHEYVTTLLDLPERITHEEAMDRFYEAAMIIDEMNGEKPLLDGPQRAGGTMCGAAPYSCDDLLDDDYDFEDCPPSLTVLPRASILVAEYDVIMAEGGFTYPEEGLYCEQRGDYTTAIPETRNDDLRHISWVFYDGGGCGWAPCVSSDYAFATILNAIANHSLIIGNTREVSAYRDPSGKVKYVGHFMNVFPCGTKLIRRVCYDPNYKPFDPGGDWLQ